MLFSPQCSFSRQAFSHREKKHRTLRVEKTAASGLGTWAPLPRPDALRHLTVPPGYIYLTTYFHFLLFSPICIFFYFSTLRFLFPVNLFIFFFLFFFLSLLHSLSFFFFYHLYLYILFLHSFCTYLYVYISLHVMVMAISAAANLLSVHMYVCAFLFFFFLYCIRLAVYFFISAYPCVCSLFFISFCVYSLVCTWILLKCICMLDGMYFFVYIFICIFYLSKCIYMAVYYINKKCISKVDIQKEEVHTLCCPYFFAGCCRHDIKMHRHACTSKKTCPAGRPYLKKCIHLPAYFFSGFMYTHACTLFSSLIILPAPFRLPAAGIFPPFLCAFLLPFSSWCFCDCFATISLPLCRQTYILFYTFSSLLQPIFCTSFSSYIIENAVHR